MNKEVMFVVPYSLNVFQLLKLKTSDCLIINQRKGLYALAINCISHNAMCLASQPMTVRARDNKVDFTFYHIYM